MSKIDHPKYEEFLNTFEDFFGVIPGRNKVYKKEEKRRDWCHDCNSDLYTHAMTFKCLKCHKIILGGV